MNKEVNQEVTRHMEEIFRENNDPLIIEKRKLKRKKEEKIKNKLRDLGL